MDIREEKTKQGTVLKLTRSLDRTNCPQLDHSMEKLFSRRKEAVWVDVSGLTSIDSAGLTLFLKWHRRALNEGRKFAFVNSAEYHRKLKGTDTARRFHNSTIFKNSGFQTKTKPKSMISEG